VASYQAKFTVGVREMGSRSWWVVLLIVWGLPSTLWAQKPQPKATSHLRQLYVQEQEQNLTPANFDLRFFPVGDRYQRHWEQLLWAVAVLEPEAPFVLQALDQILALAGAQPLTAGQRQIVRSALQVSHQLLLHRPQAYGTLQERLRQIAEASPDPEWTAMAIAALHRSGISRSELYALLGALPRRFAHWARHAFLYTTVEQISHELSRPPLPPLADLLHWQVAPQQVHLFVFCQSDRQELCFALLQDREGKFVHHQGKLWSVPLLLASIHSLDWNFYRGATPQGIYRMEGTVPQPDDSLFRAYGQFELIKLFVPWEDGVQAFLPPQKGKFQGDLQAYLQLLPPSWRHYFPMQQTYWAGRIGRSLFRIHGSGEAPDYFRRVDQRRGEWNPTLGCLSSIETYDSHGNLVRGDMPQILQQIRQVGNGKIEGFVIVVDLPEPMGVEEIAKIATNRASN
jgi:hypothetical protein